MEIDVEKINILIDVLDKVALLYFEAMTALKNDNIPKFVEKFNTVESIVDDLPEMVNNLGIER